MNIQWQYFFGSCGKRSFDRYYKSEIKVVRIEMHHSQKCIEYSIGNIGKAKRKFKTEEKLIKALKKIKPTYVKTIPTNKNQENTIKKWG